MSSRENHANICGEQDCPRPPNRPGQPLCLEHFRAFQAGDIDKCLNCSGTYKPSGYPKCRACNQLNRRVAGDAQVREQRNEYVDDSKGWNLQPEPEPAAKAPLEVAQAVNRVRENITTHRWACENHETNTIQYLIMPMLKGLGWDEYNPAQVVKEYKPAGRQRYRQAIAVDVALMDKGSPVAFIEAKRLNREYTDDYMKQLSKYAAHLENGKTAVLTNGQFWIVCTVADGQPIHRDTINIAAGEVDSVAVKLNNAVGRSAAENNGNPPRTSAPTSQAAPDRDAIVRNLKQYRDQQAKKRKVPPHYVLSNQVIDRIADQRPNDFPQLHDISGVGPAIMEQHGNAIIAIVLGK